MASAPDCAERFPLTALVDTRQGTDSTPAFSRGNTLPLTVWPNGMAAWTPQTEESHWIFNYRAAEMQGIRLTHQPSPWIGDYGHYLITPSSGASPSAKVTENASSYDIAQTVARPDYFQARLRRFDILVEIAPTERGGILRFRFPAGAAAWLTLRPARGNVLLDESTPGAVVGSCTAHRGRSIPGFACHLFAQCTGEILAALPCRTDCLDQEMLGLGDSSGLHLCVAPDAEGWVELRVGTSFIGVRQAQLNLQREAAAHDFGELRRRAAAAWERRLGVAQVEGGDRDRRTFYACLYRCNLFPRLWHECDATGATVHFSPFTGRVEPGVFYTDLGLWDSYRAHFPLLVLLYPDLARDILTGWLNVAREGGGFPNWASPGYRSCMVGSHAHAAFAEALAKGVSGVDYRAALTIAQAEAARDPTDPATGRIGAAAYNELGYVPCDEFSHSAARTLDYAFCDFAIAQMAHQLNDPKTGEVFANRALNYRRVFDPRTGFLRGRRRDGTWPEPFSEFAWTDDYIEGSAWQHTWMAPHDPAGLAACFGGPVQLGVKLDLMLAADPLFEWGAYGQEIHEMTEMATAGFGQYAHCNEPVHHVLYLYASAGRPDRLHYWVDRVRRELYGPGPGGGFPGDEDNGAMAAWYIFSALGFFPLCPGHEAYVWGTPLFSRVTLALPGGPLVLRTSDGAEGSPFVRQISIDGRAHHAAEITHAALSAAGEIHFQMSSLPVPLSPEWKPPFSLSTAGRTQ